MVEKIENRGKKGYRRKKGESKPNRPISKTHIHRLLEHCDNTREHLILHLLLETGMRGSDLVQIHWNNINLNEKTYLYISKKTQIEVYVPLSERTINLLNKYGKIHPGDKVFNFSTQRLRQILKQIKLRAKITRKISPHDFCTTAISNLAKKGVPIKAIADITGRSPKTIGLYYQKYDIDELREFQAKANILEG
jgi:integrase/recombinase XerD